MQRCVAFIILVIKYLDPTQQINQTYLCLTVAGPMHWGITAKVPNSQIHAKFFEKVQANWLVTLGGNVDYINSHIVQGILVGAIAQ